MTDTPKLTPSEQRVLTCLVGNTVATRDAILDALYAGRPSEPEPKIIDVFVCRLRQKLKPLGVSILTVWGRGYQLSDDSRSLVRGG